VKRRQKIILRDFVTVMVITAIVFRLGAVLRDDGRPEWIDRKEFKTLLAQQQRPEKIQMLQKQR
jgi:hypothetical protein